MTSANIGPVLTKARIHVEDNYLSNELDEAWSDVNHKALPCAICGQQAATVSNDKNSHVHDSIKQSTPQNQNVCMSEIPNYHLISCVPG